MEAAGATGDIWSTGAFSFESPLKDLLDRGDYTLEELLAEDELLQELRGMHPQLIQFFSTEEAVVGLVQYVIQQKRPAVENGDVATTATDDSIDAPDDEKADDTKKQGHWLFPPMENSPLKERTPQELEELQKIRYPYMACEVICCEISSIIDILVDGHIPSDGKIQGHVEQQDSGDQAVEVTTRPQAILDLLFSLLEKEEVDDLRAGYFDKVLSVLFRKRPKAMSAYINSGGGKGAVTLMTAMMNHLYSHSIMQIVQRLLLPPATTFNENEEEEDSEDENVNITTAESLFTCRWSELDESITLLLDNLIVSSTDDVALNKSQNASEVLITVIQNSPLTSPTLLSLTSDPVMARIVTAACTLPEGTEFSPHDSSLTCAMVVLESLVLQLGGYGSVGTPLETEEENAADTILNENENDEASLKDIEVVKPSQQIATADALVRHLPQLLKALGDLLRHPCTQQWQSPMQFSKPEQQPLLGLSRLRIVRLVESLVLLGNPEVDLLLCESDCLAICLDLFWEFQWCSMLHQSVANLLVHVFEGANGRAELQEYFLLKCNLLGRLMDSFEEKQEEVGISQELLRLPSEGRLSPVDSSLCNASTGAVFGDSEDEVIPVSDDDVDAALEQEENKEQQESSDEDSSLEQQENASEETNEQETPIEAKEAEQETPTDATENQETPKKLPENTSTLASGVELEGPAKEESDVKSSIPSLRMGCLGHVMIICQALVHACTHNVEQPEEEGVEDANESGFMRSIDLGDVVPPDTTEEASTETNESEQDETTDSPSPEVPENFQPVADKDDGQVANGPEAQEEDSASHEAASNDLVIARLIESHPLHAQWDEFVVTTLASETAIQSTPLGGTNTAAVDPMPSQILNVARSNRTYDFSEDDGEESTGPNGFLGGGEVLDMDDNDLDIAASMMEALSLSPRPREDNDESSGSRPDAAVTFGTVIQNSGSQSADYIFDDPLGDASRFNNFGQGDSDEDESEEATSGVENGSKSELPGKDDEEDEAPVMDLFTGNFELDKSPTQPLGGEESNAENGTWSNFANFDDAFAAANTNMNTIFGSGSSDEDEAAPENAGTTTDAFESVENDKDLVDDLFGSTPHALLLGDDDDMPLQESAPEESAPEVSAPVESKEEDLSDSSDEAEVNNDSEVAETSITDVPSETPSEEPTPEIHGSEPKLETAIS